VTAGRAAALILALTLLPNVAAQQHPNTQKGFDPNRVYDFGSLDSINTFNGNLIVTIPLGQQYKVSNTLSYSFGLVYNGSPWDSVIMQLGPIRLRAEPDRRSNAGLGWLVSLGRLLSPSDPANQTSVFETDPSWVYESPDGNDHKFPPEEATGAPPGSFFGVVDSPSGMRMYKKSATEREIHFRDGRVHEFEDLSGGVGNERWRITKIRDAFNNKVEIGYPATAGGEVWEVKQYQAGIAAPVRIQKLFFVDRPSTTPVPQRTLDRVELTAFGGGSTARKLTYRFEYGNAVSIPRPWWDQAGPEWQRGADYTIYQLKSVTAESDTGVALQKYEMSYLDSSNGFQGHLDKLRLPSGGYIDWDYAERGFPEGSSLIGTRFPMWGEGIESRESKPGVHIKRLLDSAGQVVVDANNRAAEWTYGHQAGNAERCPVPGNDTATFAHVQQLVTSVTGPPDFNSENPDLSGTISRITYYSVSQGNECYPNERGWDLGQYGKPLTRYVSTVGSDGTTALFLSEEVRRDVTSLVTSPVSPVVGGTLLRRTLRAWEYLLNPPQGAYETEIASRSEFSDDTSCPKPGTTGTEVCWVETYHGQHAGYGRFKQRSVRTNIGGDQTRTSFSNYLTPAFDSLQPWVLDRYDEQCVTDAETVWKHVINCSSLAGAVTEKFDFEPTGFLKRHRKIRNGETSRRKDLVVDFTSAAVSGAPTGDVAKEEYSGGDGGGAPDDTTAAVVTFRIFHEYQAGVRKKSTYDGVSYPFLDLDIDAGTGLAYSSRDSSGAETDYAYDELGRLTSVAAPGVHAVSYTYSGGLFNSPAVVMEQGSGPSALWARYEFDDLGRLSREITRIPAVGATENAVRAFKLDASGRKIAEAESHLAGTPPEQLKETKTRFDGFDRAVRVERPDGSVLERRYAAPLGSSPRILEITAKRNGQIASWTRETYDGFGRLAAVTQKVKPPFLNGQYGDAQTGYAYDVADRLTGVTMGQQERSFEYDSLGLLRREVHPESGETSYLEYDARGHAGLQRVSSTRSLFDLRFQFDSAERLVAVLGRKPAALANDDPSSFRTLKTLAYGNSNQPAADGEPENRARGKITRAERYNFRVAPFFGLPEYDRGKETLLVIEDYEYRSLTGQRSKKTTTIQEQDDYTGLFSTVKRIVQSSDYDSFGLPTDVQYPMCVDCGIPTGNPARALSPTYSQGHVVSLPDFVDQITFWPNGLMSKIKHAKSRVVDAQSLDGGLTRPSAISFGAETLGGSGSGFVLCAPPAITTHPAGQSIGSGQSATLAVASTGTGPLHYQWYEFDTATTVATTIPGATTSSVTVAPTQTKGYFVRTSNDCNFVDSNLATVTVDGACSAPRVVSLSGGGREVDDIYLAIPSMPGAPLTLGVVGGGSAPLSYTWKADGVFLANGTSVTVTPTIRTVYTVTVSNACGNQTGTIVATFSPAAPTGLVAAKSGPNQISLQWISSGGATQYEIYRASGNGSFSAIGATAGISFTDTAAATNRAYAYYVIARNAAMESSSPSNVDVATTLSFTPVAPNMAITPGPLHELLASLNALRAISGLAAVGWSEILPGDPAPAAGIRIHASHVVSLRRETTQALQRLGVIVPPWTDAHLANAPVRAVHITELQARGQ
jgi:YD repeat-containing protein